MLLRLRRFALVSCAALSAVFAAAPASAEEQPSTDRVEFHGQATYIWQRKPAFAAAYSGDNSLETKKERSYSFSGTLFSGWRLGRSTAAFVDLEVIQGVPISGLLGLGSPSNGEMQKVAGSNPKAYFPRVYLQHTVSLGGDSERVASAAHQLAGVQPSRRLVVTAGKFAVTDLFDLNTYAHDPRTQFLTWASVAHGAWDYPADSQGYTDGAAIEWFHDDWELRVGRFAMPTESNGPKLDKAIGRHHGDALELVHRHQLAGRPGALRALWWRNAADMGRFDDALAAASGGTPDVTLVRRHAAKRGWGLHLEQSLAEHLGGFVRASAGDGRTEVFAFEEVDRHLQAGLAADGKAWRREGDTIGLLWSRQALSGSHRDYLARGGLGYFVGDGALRYAAETTIEAYYRWAIRRDVALTIDAQHVRNPGYNADRGPVRFVAARLHAEF